MGEKHFLYADKVIHVYAQGWWHDEATIVGNREALVALQTAVANALGATDGRASIEVFAVDGEGYTLNVTCESAVELAKRRLPYTDSMLDEMYQDAEPPPAAGDASAG